jgi:hypothetical protein
MAEHRRDAIHRSEPEITNRSIALNFGEEAVTFMTLTPFPARTNDRAPRTKLDWIVDNHGMRMKTGLTLTEVDERIAAIRENLEQLVEQSTADSSADNDDLNAARIAEQEQELAELTELRETLLRK